jgi:hypothetical protein
MMSDSVDAFPILSAGRTPFRSMVLKVGGFAVIAVESSSGSS